MRECCCGAKRRFLARNNPRALRFSCTKAGHAPRADAPAGTTPHQHLPGAPLGGWRAQGSCPGCSGAAALGALGAGRLLELLLASAAPTPPAWLPTRARTNQVAGRHLTTCGQHGGGMAGSWGLAGHQGQRQCKALAGALDGAARAAGAEVLFRPHLPEKWSARCQHVLPGVLECRGGHQHGCSSMRGPGCVSLA